MKTILFKAASAFILLLLSFYGNAASCTKLSSGDTINIGSVNSPGWTGTRTYIGEDYSYGTKATLWNNCKDYSFLSTAQKPSQAQNGTIGGLNVYNTNIAGVGYILGYAASFDDPSGCTFKYAASDSVAPNSSQDGGGYGGCAVNGSPKSVWGQPKTRLVITGPTSGGVLNFHMGQLYIGSTAQGWNYEIPVNVTGVINIKTCTVNTTTVNVKLGEYLTTEFTGVGHTTANQAVPISLNCNVGTRINALITADADTTLSQGGAIKPDEGGASGVAVQLLDKNDQAVTLNKKFTVDTVTGDGQYNFYWKARYLQTLSTVTSGEVNAHATLTLSYE